MQAYRLLAIVIALLPLAGPAMAEEKGPSPLAVHRAIQSGAEWLKGQYPDGFKDRKWHDTAELLVLTLHHAGANLTDATYKAAIEFVQKVELRYTYRVSVMAMALSEINPRMYEARLAHCAQWLVDTQLEHGEWGYPGSISGPGRQPYPGRVAPPAWPPEEFDEDGNPIGKPDTARREGKLPPVVRHQDVPTFEGEKGDFSNTQFAILGLRACRDAGIEIPKQTWKNALAYLVKSQRKDGGWGYHYDGKQDDASYASLTCAGVCSVAVCLHALGKRPEGHSAVKKARSWLEKNFDEQRNVGIDRSTIMGPSSWQYYHLYSLERVGSVLGWKTIRDKAWYPAGARCILATQRGGGGWVDPAGWDYGGRPGYLGIADTCFAILFLAKATPPLTGG